MKWIQINLYSVCGQASHYRQPTGVLLTMSITNRCFLVCVSILLGITGIHILLGICPLKKKKAN